MTAEMKKDIRKRYSRLRKVLRYGRVKAIRVIAEYYRISDSAVAYVTSNASNSDSDIKSDVIAVVYNWKE